MMAKPKLINVLITRNQRVGPGYYLMRLASPAKLGWVGPGQFVHVKLPAGPSGVPLLRRPFSIYNVSASGKSAIEILYRVAGQGTRVMTRLKVGAQLNLLGPLGNGYRINHKAKYSILVAGGMGIAGLHLLLQELARNIRRNKYKGQVYLLVGARIQKGIYIPTIAKIPEIEVIIATEDGSRGQRGYVTQLLEETIYGIPGQVWSKIQVYACGPQEMSREVAKITVPLGIPCQVSLEAHMACGLGFCRGCVVPIQDGSSKRYAAVCSEGPIFEARQIYGL